MTHAIVQPTSLLEPQCIDQLRLEISYILDAGTKLILLDCRNIEFMNSSSLGILVTILKQAQRHHSEIILCGLNAQAQRIIELANLDQLFKTYSDCQAFEQTLVLA
ncbi:STAS domain-containing protein [Acaryochloris sp. IP29b_bin.148]|uniref:STAS domain-containing protein n=1 Tax=Acaryochloris sp. IP29b_bin.148 TaxID=2969218 RepID=UPI0026370E8C|nr:STAS domain-containing protein [Acaryochloris sp. IP29b_bin.148]